MLKKILVVVESIDVEDSSGSKANVALIKNLNNAGFDLRVYHYTRKAIHLEGIECVAINENRRSLLFFLSRLERYFRYFFKINLNKHLEKVFGFSFTLFNDRNSIVHSLNSIDNFKPDLIFTLSKGGSFRPHHALLKIPKWHSRWLAYIHDPYPAHLYPRPFAWVESGYQKKWQFVQDVSEKAAYSGFPSQLLMEWMGSYYPNFLKTGVVIPHQLDKEETLGVSIPDYFDPKKFNLLHAGTLLGPRNPIPLILAFQQFLNKFPEASQDSKLLLIGNNELYIAQLQQYLKRIPSSNFIVEPYSEYNKVLKMQMKTAVNVILEAKSEISPFLPGKFPHCVLANKPILLLGPNLSETKRLLGENYKYWAEADDIENITLLMSKLYLEWKNSKDKFKLNRPDLLEYLSSDKLKEVISTLKV
ncbi:UDP-glycosyltransferase [Gillisia sp. JM1]|uniref:UDP-glycosyltransferase n=1 Tax=Gillisia sp. JM1 TaxID=1283286 RepID=UPI00047D315C|nr:UDP-glycosyltransferase [Gillisia sp. JM1]